VEYEIYGFEYDDFFTPVKVDTIHYFLKEVIDSTFYDAELRPSFKILRYQRAANDTAVYQLSDVWYATKSAQRLEVVEENLRLIKLIFPVRFGAFWNGNALNTEPEQTYRLGYVNKPEMLSGMNFSSVVQVVQAYEENLIEKQFQEERYAKGVGLIYKKVLDVKTEVSGEVRSGIDVSWKAIAYGVE
jgi:hypothetical protein